MGADFLTPVQLPGPLTDAQRKLVEDNHNLIYAFIRKKGLRDEDWYDVFALVLCRVAQIYDPARGTLATLFYCLAEYKYRNTVRDEIRMMGRVKLRFEMTPEFAESWGYDEPGFEEAEVDAYLDELRKKLSPSEKRILELLMGGEMQADVARELGVTPQNISQAMKQIRKKAESNERDF